MTAELPIRYRGYWDVPRIFLVRHRGQLVMFDCPFSVELDEYPDVFTVYLLPDIADDDTPNDWTTLIPRATAILGEVPVKSVRFDATRRQTIGAEVFDLLPLASVPAAAPADRAVAPTGATGPVG